MTSLSRQIAAKELKKRKAGTTGPIERLRSVLSPLQIDFIDNPSNYKLARCGRRAGKSYMAAVLMIITCLLTSDMPVLYLALTRESAMNIIWKPLTTMLYLCGINYDPQISRGRIVFDNGSYIQVFGADAPDAVNRLRGQPWKLIIADEMGFIRSRSADELLDTLIPSIADFDGTVIMMSSPSLVPDGLFYDCDQGDKKEDWYRVSWDMRANPYFQRPAKDPKYANRAEEVFADVIKKKYGGNSDHPAFRREFLGEWVFDASNLIYPYTENNVIRSLPQELRGTYHHAIGIDFGSSSATSYAVLRYSEFSRQVELVQLFKRAGMLVDEMANELRVLVDKYNPNFIEADTGGLGKVPAEEMRRRYGLPVNAAEKTNKTFYQALVRNDLAANYIKVLSPTCDEILTEWKKIVRGDDGEEVKGQENHAADAFLYAYRKIYNIHLRTFEPPLSYEDKIIDSLEKRAMQERMDLEEDLDNIDDF